MLRLMAIESESLSEFFGFRHQIRAGILLPRDYDANAKYPVVYDITGFGGTHQSIHRKLERISADSYLQQCIVVVPDPSNRYGHSVFCNSRSIGPWGDALVRELIPQLEERYGGAGADHRYVTGASSGGWSCLYLQVAYPKEFAGLIYREACQKLAVRLQPEDCHALKPHHCYTISRTHPTLHLSYSTVSALQHGAGGKYMPDNILV